MGSTSMLAADVVYQPEHRRSECILPSSSWLSAGRLRSFRSTMLCPWQPGDSSRHLCDRSRSAPESPDRPGERGQGGTAIGRLTQHIAAITAPHPCRGECEVIATGYEGMRPAVGRRPRRSPRASEATSSVRARRCFRRRPSPRAQAAKISSAPEPTRPYSAFCRRTHSSAVSARVTLARQKRPKTPPPPPPTAA